MIRIALLLAAAAAAAPAAPKPPQDIRFTTADGWTISALYRAPRRIRPVVILVHGVASSKGEWDAFARRLEEQGVGTLALDLRGHKDSTKGPKGVRTFEDFDAAGEWPRAEADLDAAAAWLTRHKIPGDRIAFGGASVGANLASIAAAKRPRTPFLLLLSPGPDYRGVKPLLRPGLKTLAGASPGDGYSHQTLGPISAVKGAATFEAPSGHGVQMFDDKATLDKVVAWTLKAAGAVPPGK